MIYEPFYYHLNGTDGLICTYQTETCFEQEMEEKSAKTVEINKRTLQETKQEKPPSLWPLARITAKGVPRLADGARWA